MKRFFERYEKLCAEHGISPTGKQIVKSSDLDGERAPLPNYTNIFIVDNRVLHILYLF